MPFREQNWVQSIVLEILITTVPDSKVHEANMGPIRGRQDPGGPHVGPMNFAIWGVWGSAKSCWYVNG